MERKKNQETPLLPFGCKKQKTSNIVEGLQDTYGERFANLQGCSHLL